MNFSEIFDKYLPYLCKDPLFRIKDTDPRGQLITDPVLLIHDILVRVRILLFCQWPSKATKFFAYYFLKLHLYHFPKIESHKEVTKQ
jgi:hypothetical protein